jgi:dihydrofolate reductase
MGGEEVIIIGGGAVFEVTVPLWDRLLLTVVEGNFRGETYFPLDRVRGTRWRNVSRVFCDADAKNVHPSWFLELERYGMTADRFEDFDLGAWLRSESGSTTELPPNRG